MWLFPFLISALACAGSIPPTIIPTAQLITSTAAKASTATTAITPAAAAPAPSAPTASAAPQTASPPRSRIKSIKNYVVYYGKGRLNDLARYDLVIVQRGTLTESEIAELKKRGTLVVAYISTSEATKDDTRAEAQWRLGSNRDWKVDVIDVNQEGWRKVVLAESKEVMAKGFDGLFLDTVEDVQTYPQMKAGMITLIQSLRQTYPNSLLIQNGGYGILNNLGATIDALMFEDLSTGYDFDKKKYVELDNNDTAREVQSYTQRSGLPVLALDYASPDDPAMAQRAVANAWRFGFVPSVSVIMLDDIPDYGFDFSDTARARRERLAKVSRWFYYLNFDPNTAPLQKIVDSSYDMVVIDPQITDRNNQNFPIANVIKRLHNAPHPKLVMAYIDIGQAENWRTYWQKNWKVGNPPWIVGNDPDGWSGNFPVAYWWDDWRNIWLGKKGYLQKIIDAGFDGVYLDWVEGYSDENVIAAAKRDATDPQKEMIRWVGDLATYARGQKPNFIVIAQNATELAARDDYMIVIDAISQEQTWFDGGADNTLPGDCPLPRTEADVESAAYLQSLSAACRKLQQQTHSTLHVSSESYIRNLKLARDKGKVIFTVDYALDPKNVSWVYQTSRALNFIPFVGERMLKTYFEPVP